MSQSFEKAVKGGTKIKLAAPKAKYVEHILIATHAGEAGVAEVFRTMTYRLRDSTWTIVFKALIVVHLMIREGEPGVTLRFLGDQPNKLAISNFSDVQQQGANIRHYDDYILTRARAYRDTKIDWVKQGEGRLKKQTIDKGLLRETESVQRQISALLKCDMLTSEPENEISLTAFRLLTMDLLTLFQIMNEGTINILEHYFEMSKYDAERALAIYKKFATQTSQVVDFLGVARQHQAATRLEIPKLRHAPISLTASLEEYVNDPDFEINRTQFLATTNARKGSKSAAVISNAASSSTQRNGTSNKPVVAPQPVQALQPPATKGPPPDLMDFFDSIELPQQPQQQQFQLPNGQVQLAKDPVTGQIYQVGAQSQAQPTVQQNGTNLFGQIQQQQAPQLNPQFTGAGFGGYGPQSQQQHPQMPQIPQQIQQPFNPNQPQLSGLQNTPTAYHDSQSQMFGQTQQSQFSTAQQQPFQIGQDQTFSPLQQQPFPTGQQGFGGEQAQLIQPLQTGMQPMQTGQQSANPFRKSQFIASPDSSSFGNHSPVSPLQRQSTNPFARPISQHQSQPSPFASQPPPMPNSATSAFFTPLQSPQQPQPMQSQPTAVQPLQPQRTGTNPFARNTPTTQFSTPITSPLLPNQTGSTNPFRQSQFINQQTGQGWQAGQGTMGGLEQLPTIPVFPRPGVAQTGQSPWS